MLFHTAHCSLGLYFYLVYIFIFIYTIRAHTYTRTRTRGSRWYNLKKYKYTKYNIDRDIDIGEEGFVFDLFTCSRENIDLKERSIRA